MKTVKQFVNEVKWMNFKIEAKRKFDNVVYWIKENKEVVLIVVPIVSGVVGKAFSLAKMTARRNNLNEEKELKELYVYDRSLGHYWKLRRPVRNSEWITINERKKHGESIGDILESLRLLE